MPPGWCRCRSSSLPPPARWGPPLAALPSSVPSPSAPPVLDPSSFRRTPGRRARPSRRVLSTALPRVLRGIEIGFACERVHNIPRTPRNGRPGRCALVFRVETPRLRAASPVGPHPSLIPRGGIVRRLVAVAALTALVAGPRPVRAQRPPPSWSPELGVQGGFSRFKFAGTGGQSKPADFFDVPGFVGLAPAIPAGISALYAIVPVAKQLALEAS